MVSIEIEQGKKRYFVDFQTYVEAQTWLLLGSYLGDKGTVFVHVTEPHSVDSMCSLMREAMDFYLGNGK